MTTIIDPTTDKRWDVFVTNHPESTIFHHSAWCRVLMDVYNCTPRYYINEDDNGQISAAAPFFRITSPVTGKRLVCLPFCEFCYPLAYREDDLIELMDEIKREVVSERSSYLEIRGWGKLGTPEQMGLKDYSYFLIHIINLDGNLQKIRCKMDRNGRYNLRYAEKSPVKIHVGQDEKDLRKFYQLVIHTRNRHNLFPQPYRFFQSIYRHLIIPEYGYFLLAELNGKTIAANMYFCYKDMIIHEFSAQDRNYFKYRPNYLLIWKALERACQESYHYYHFGRTQPENQQLMKFKRHWGSEETIFPYYFYPIVRGISSISRSSPIYHVYRSINKFLPEFIFKLFGNTIYKHLG